MRLQDHVELELKLTVVGPDPDGFLAQVARLDRIGPISLGPAVEHQLLDVYWDYQTAHSAPITSACD